MKRARREPSVELALPRGVAELRARLSEAEQTLHAIHTGEADAVVVTGKRGSRVFTLEGAEHAYRVLIESMHEGALTLTEDKVILYANRRFAAMVGLPLEQVVGGSFRRFLSPKDRATLRSIVKRGGTAGSNAQILLLAGDGSRLPAQVSIRRLPRIGASRATIGMVVTDTTEARRNEAMLRSLSRRLVETQEAERGRVALELHDHITQLLCAVLFRAQALTNALSARDGPLRKEAATLRDMLSMTADEVERISRDLRPSVLDELGLTAVLRATTAEFSARTRVPVELTLMRLVARLPAVTELTLYRILQEALNNVERHARARHVAVRLSRKDGFVRMVIGDDGSGFDPERRPRKTDGKSRLGLLTMRERASYAGGTLEIKSARRGGTEVDVRIPVPRKSEDRG